MNIREDFKEIVKETQENNKEFVMSPRDFIGYFSYAKRTKGNSARIDNYLESVNLETIPNYKNVYIDGSMTLKHKAKAKSKSETDPIQRISILPSANKPPLSIPRDAKLSESITLMMMNNFSQLPVMSNPRTVAGFITWESIGSALNNGIHSDDVKDYLKTDFRILNYDTPLLEAIAVTIDKEYVLVQKKDKVISGIVTIADISSQFLTLTEPFLILEQIENLIRLILDGKFLIEELKELCSDGESDYDVQFIDDLTFGQYIRLIEKPDNWDRLELKIDRGYFIKQLNIIREIRNDIMHFDPEGITFDQRRTLTNMAKFLLELKKYKKL